MWDSTKPYTVQNFIPIKRFFTCSLVTATCTEIIYNIEDVQIQSKKLSSFFSQYLYFNKVYETLV